MIRMVSMPTLETVVNITSVPMGLPTTTVVLLEHSGARPVSTVTGQLMWSVEVQVAINIYCTYCILSRVM